MPDPRNMTWQEIDEQIDAIVTNYRAGVVGPISVVAELTIFRVPVAEAEKIRDTYRDENARNRRSGGAMEQGGISDRLSNFDEWGNRIRNKT